MSPKMEEPAFPALFPRLFRHRCLAGNTARIYPNAFLYKLGSDGLSVLAWRI
jgi:hypothetical protein